MPKGKYIRTEEIRQKNRLAIISYYSTHKHPWQGKNHTQSTKIKISRNNARAWIGRKHTDETKEKMRKWQLGVQKPWNAGVKNANWKGGITELNEQIRKSREYKEWRRTVYARDGYICVLCGTCGNGSNLHADHIKPFALYPELRFDIENGRTLCISCHLKTSTWGRRGKSGLLNLSTQLNSQIKSPAQSLPALTGMGQ